MAIGKKINSSVDVINFNTLLFEKLNSKPITVKITMRPKNISGSDGCAMKRRKTIRRIVRSQRDIADLSSFLNNKWASKLVNVLLE